ncbi:hypothetical protein ACHAWF_013547 [Thalassiosira exigua]
MASSSRDNTHLTAFLVGAFAGSAVSLIFANHYLRRIDPQAKINDAESSASGRQRGSINDDETTGVCEETAPVAPASSTDESQETSSICNGHHTRQSIRKSDASSTSSNRSQTSFTIGGDKNNNNDDSSSHRSLGSNGSRGYNPKRRQLSYTDDPQPGTNVTVITEEEWDADDEIITEAKDFDENVLSKLESKDEMTLLLRRTRAVNALAHRLTVAKDEKSCFEEVSRLIVPLFRIDGCGFALMKDSENIIFKHITVNKLEYAQKLGLEGGPDGLVKPLNETAAAMCAKTLKQDYCPRTKDSPFPAQRNIVHKIGLNTILVTPILIDGDTFAGCILTCMRKEDGFREYDRVLMNNVATMLGSSIYAKRMKIASETSNKISREMLHSMIPPKVIERIECYWDERTVEYQSRRGSSFIDSSIGSSLDESDRMFAGDDDFSTDNLDLIDEVGHPAPNAKTSINPMRRLSKRERGQQHRQSISAKINLLNEMNKPAPEQLGNAGMVIDTSAMELTSTHRALYAETLSNVCIIFTDIVGFSHLSLHMKPIKVMDMLQDLFSRFDSLCDRYGIQKLETIGDAYICTTGMFDEDTTTAAENSKNLATSAAKTLEMAKEMVKEAEHVIVPMKNQIRTLEIRVGIHVGEITCGVLGERLPKFTVFGNAVNMAARMEQTSLPSRIRVTKDFYDLLPEPEIEEWQGKEVISVKNMGEVETYLLDPL